MAIKDKGKGAPRIVVTDKPKPRIDPHELAKRLGADIVIEAPNFGGGPMGMMARAGWFAKRQAKMREMRKQSGFAEGDHVRLWIKNETMSTSGRVRWFQETGGRPSVVIDCVNGKTRCFDLEFIEKSINFGGLMPKEHRPRFGRPKRKLRK